jgi:methionyl-tRNA formyltransferase
LSAVQLNKDKAKIIFFGTPEFALPALSALVKNPNLSVVAVVTQPDKPAGRGQKLTAPPVKVLAEELGLSVFQPTSLKTLKVCSTTDGCKILEVDGDEVALANHLKSYPIIDAAVAVAYGKLIPAELLDFPKFGFINIHPSLLPRWRGAAPLQHTIFAGDTETGVAIMKIDHGLDTGPVYALKKVALEPKTTFGALHDKLSILGAELLAQTLTEIISGKLQPKAQTNAGSTYAEKWEKEDCHINWQDQAEVTLNRILASNPYPGAFTHYQGQIVKIFDANISEDKNFPKASPGTVVEVTRNEIIVATGSSSYISLLEIQLAGKKRLTTKEVLQGFKININSVFGIEK